MADAAGLAVGLVSLGLQVASGITRYIDALNCRDKDIASVRQQNDSLQRLLENIETSLSTFQQSHEVATDAVRKCLESSKKELSTLECLLADLTACDKSSERRKDRIKSQGKKLLYPFSRPKVEQLEARLANANMTLELAQQSLQLSVSQLGVEKLAALEKTSQAISSSVHATQSTVSSIHAPLQHLSRDVSGIETRVEGLEALLMHVLATQPAGGGIPQQASPSVAAGRLLGKPSLLRDVCDAAGVGARTGPSQKPPVLIHGATESDKVVSLYTEGRYSCMCRHRSRLRRKDTVWGSFRFSFEEATEKHLPGCSATQVLVATDRSQRFSLTYTGFRRLLNVAIQVSFALPCGAGARSLGPTFAYYPTVDREIAPAFRILSLISRCPAHIDFKDRSFYGTFISSAMSLILRLFRAEKASPRAVDANNRSLIYHLAICINGASPYLSLSNKDPAHFPLLELLECLLVNKAPANDYDIFGLTPLSMLCDLYERDIHENALLAAAAELILRENVDETVAWRFESRPETPWAILEYGDRRVWPFRLSTFDDHLNLLSLSTKVAEAYGCGPLSLAILFQNLEQVGHLVRNHPATLAERNLFGHTPLHLAADKPCCLRLLVKLADYRSLNQMNTPSEDGKSALEAAVMLSGRSCRESATSRMCRRCRCAECAIILLKADCAVPLSQNIRLVFRDASKRCKLKYIRHFKDRRDRLKQLALTNLPGTQLERLGLMCDRVLDARAPETILLLEERGVHIPEALSVSRNEPFSVYQELDSPEDAELFFRAGFRDMDLWCKAGAAELAIILSLTGGLGYLHWLATHGAPSLQLKSLASAEDVFIAHFIFERIGAELKHRRYPFHGCMDWIHELHSTTLPANTADSCHCKCSPGGCTPITSLLKRPDRFLNRFEFKVNHLPGDSRAQSANSPQGDRYEDTDDRPMKTTGAVLPPRQITCFTKYLLEFGGHLEARHHTAALRYLTFTALRIPHTCCLPHDLGASQQSEEKAAEVEDEHAYELDLLEELLAEFEGEVVAILQDSDQRISDLIAFWKFTWVGRMFKVLNSLEGSDLGDEERREAERIGVVWDRPQPLEVPDNPYDKNDLDYWMHELEKIESECE